MSTKTMKILTVIATILMIVAIATSTVYAATTPDDVKNAMVNSTMDTGKITDLGGSIMKILQTVGVVLAVVILIILGIKYMMGSAEEKADYKKTMIPYIVGAILIFGATTVANVVYQFATGI